MTESLSLAAVALVLALCIDVMVGEPPVRWHPVVWIGRYLDAVSTWFAPVAGSSAAFSCERAFGGGAFFWLLGAVVCVGLAFVLQYGLDHLPLWAGAVVLGLLLKPLFAWAMLCREVQAVECAMTDSLESARDRLAWLCSRDVHQLSETQVRETLIETLAENLNDSVVAPLFWFVMLGLPGAVLYRFANTADAMWGYLGVRTGRDWTWAGKWAAHADDALSWLPARLTAVLLVLVSGQRAWASLREEATKTPSPNSGWPMAAMAMALNVRLGKPGVYTLHPQGLSPKGCDSKQALQFAHRVVWCVAVLGVVALQSKGSFA